LPPVASVSIDAIQDAVAPTTSCLSTSSSCLADNVTQAIEDGDFLIQTFRDPGISEADAGNTNSSASNAQIIAFRMGVRVYSKFAKENLGSLETEAVALGMTQSIGQQNKRPLAILYTDFVRGDVTLSLQGYRKFLQP
nr:hypothetical protein [Hydrococcus sp. Prado102]